MSFKRPFFGRHRLASLRIWAALLPLSALLSPAHAAEIFSGRFYTVPEKIYVNQAFDIHFELEISPGCELEDLRIGDFPNDADTITVGRLESVSRNRDTRNQQAVDVLHFTAAARCHKPIDHTFSPQLQCMLVERRNSGFFSHWQSFPAQRQLAPFQLRVQPLPTASRPTAFSGAIGSFRLTGHLSQTSVRPGDIVTLTLELTGQGWLNQAAVPTPEASPLFKAYPAKETLREPLRVTTEQVLIPVTTNATEIAAVTFSFFNPASERYETTSAGPFRLTFAQSAAPKTDEVRVINTAEAPAAVPTHGVLTLTHTDVTLRQATPLIAVCTSAIVGILLFFMLYGRHTRFAFLVGLASLALGTASGYALGRRTTDKTQTLTHRIEVRFAPSQASAALFTLNPATPVVPLEKAGSWTRIDAAGLRGWIPSSGLSK